VSDTTDAGAGGRANGRWSRPTKVTMSDRLKAANIKRKHGVGVDASELARDREQQERRNAIDRRSW
jgi:hypothetical protein